MSVKKSCKRALEVIDTFALSVRAERKALNQFEKGTPPDCDVQRLGNPESQRQPDRDGSEDDVKGEREGNCGRERKSAVIPIANSFQRQRIALQKIDDLVGLAVHGRDVRKKSTPRAGKDFVAIAAAGAILPSCR